MDKVRGNYWCLADPKLRDCKHKRMKQVVQGIVLLDYCPDCKFHFHTKDSYRVCVVIK